MGLFGDRFGAGKGEKQADEKSPPNQEELKCSKCGKPDLTRVMGTQTIVCMSCGATQ